MRRWAMVMRRDHGKARKRKKSVCGGGVIGIEFCAVRGESGAGGRVVMLGFGVVVRHVSRYLGVCAALSQRPPNFVRTERQDVGDMGERDCYCHLSLDRSDSSEFRGSKFCLTTTWSSFLGMRHNTIPIFGRHSELVHLSSVDTSLGAQVESSPRPSSSFLLHASSTARP